MEIILASSSPRRSEILKKYGVDFRAVPSEIDENLPGRPSPEETVLRLSLLKAEKVRDDYPGALVIGADTVVVHEGLILGKPRDASDAERMLALLSGCEHKVLTGVSILFGKTEKTFCERTAVRLRRLAPEVIRRYVKTGEPLDKAGAYGIQGLGALLVEGIGGDYYNVVGLPVSRLAQELVPFGIRMI